jgi:hypothetical protein
MSDNGAEVVNLSAPQQWPTTLDLTAGPLTFRNGGSPLATTTVVVAELLGQARVVLFFLFLRFGDGGPTVGNSRHKHLTEGDQRFYSSTEEPFAARSKGANVGLKAGVR